MIILFYLFYFCSSEELFLDRDMNCYTNSDGFLKSLPVSFYSSGFQTSVLNIIFLFVFLGPGQPWSLLLS